MLLQPSCGLGPPPQLMPTLYRVTHQAATDAGWSVAALVDMGYPTPPRQRNPGQIPIGQGILTALDGAPRLTWCVTDRRSAIGTVGRSAAAGQRPGSDRRSLSLIHI